MARSLILALLLFMTGCALQPGYRGATADGVSTLIVASVKEGKEIGPVAGSVSLGVGVPLAVGLRWYLVKTQIGKPHCETTVGVIDGIGVGAACANAAGLLGATGYGALALMPVCAIPYALWQKPRIRERCHPTCDLADLPSGTLQAKCVKGEVRSINHEQ